MKPVTAFLFGVAATVITYLVMGDRPSVVQPERAEARAEEYARQRDAALAVADSLARETLRLNVAMADSVARWTLARVANDSAVTSWRATAAELEASLNQALDSIAGRNFRAYIAARDSVDTATARSVDLLDAQVEYLSMANGLLTREVVMLREALKAEVGRGRELFAANLALRVALVRAERKGKLYAVAGGVVVSAVAAGALFNAVAP